MTLAELKKCKMGQKPLVITAKMIDVCWEYNLRTKIFDEIHNEIIRKVKIYKIESVNVLAKTVNAVLRTFPRDTVIYGIPGGLRVVHSTGFYILKNIVEEV